MEFRSHPAPGRRRGRPGRRGLAVACALGAALAAAAASAETATLTLDPERTAIRFEVDSTLHRVHGTLRLVRGALEFDPAGGPASGTVEVDATSADTGNGLRDDVLHEDVFESARFPRFVFHAERVDVERRAGSEADLRVFGRLDFHGTERLLDFSAHVRVEGGRTDVTASFPVPFVAWGMQDPGNFLLSVDDVVSVSVEAAGTIQPPPPR